MPDWNLEPTEQYERDHKYYEKKHPNELAAVLNNLDAYFNTLKGCGSPLQVKTGFIHDEPDGIKALDQKGGKKKVKLQQTRLYIYPDAITGTLYLLAIGDKNTQRDNIKVCREFVRTIRGGDLGEKKI